jgi:hypothetical protein
MVNKTLSLYEINSKVLFLSRCFIFGGLFKIWINTFFHGRDIFWGDCFRLRILHSGKYSIWICVVIKLLACEVASVPSKTCVPSSFMIVAGSIYFTFLNFLNCIFQIITLEQNICCMAPFKKYVLKF